LSDYEWVRNLIVISDRKSNCMSCVNCKNFKTDPFTGKGKCLREYGAGYWKKVFLRRKRRKTQKIDASGICNLKMTSITFIFPSWSYNLNPTTTGKNEDFFAPFSVPEGPIHKKYMINIIKIVLNDISSIYLWYITLIQLKIKISFCDR